LENSEETVRQATINARSAFQEIRVRVCNVTGFSMRMPTKGDFGLTFSGFKTQHAPKGFEKRGEMGAKGHLSCAFIIQ